MNLAKYTWFLKTEPMTFFSPGRVNLIGEHIDYLGGEVFPIAIDLGTSAYVTKREDQEFHLLSTSFEEVGVITASLKDLTFKKEDNWANFIKGVIQLLLSKGYKIPHGLNLLLDSNLPIGAGLSSSASIEVLTMTILNHIFDLGLTQKEMALFSKDVENNYIGVNSGIMDQYAIAFGQKDYAIHLNTSTLTHELVPFQLGDYVVMIVNTNKKRALSESKYNERRSECDQALETLHSLGVKEEDLSRVPLSVIEENKDAFSSLDHFKRARHASSEQSRVIEAVQALKDHDLSGFSTLLTQTHMSLRNDFEVSFEELDVLVDLALKNGALGARMTGAGFGGCIIAILHKNLIQAFTKNIVEEYANIIGYEPSCYIANSSDHANCIGGK